MFYTWWSWDKDMEEERVDNSEFYSEQAVVEMRTWRKKGKRYGSTEGKKNGGFNYYISIIT